MKKLLFLLVALSLLSCQQNAESEIIANDPRSCPVTEPQWITPPNDSAVSNDPVAGYYFVNDDASIMASAWWTEEYSLQSGENGNKTGWFRPAGETLEITGTRLDAEAPQMESSVPCCYPTQFQATGLIFPTSGCWEVNSQAADKRLSFIVWVN